MNGQDELTRGIITVAGTIRELLAEVVAAAPGGELEDRVHAINVLLGVKHALSSKHLKRKPARPEKPEKPKKP